MLERFRAAWTGLFTPAARLLLRWGVSPDAVTFLGTAGVALGALWFFPRGQLLAGALVVTVFACADTLDGTMARMSGRSSPWGAFLDSTLDRVGDAAVFGGLVLWYAGAGGSTPLAGLALYCLVTGLLTSYVRAKAEGLGMEAKGGIAERADRLAVTLVMTAVAGALGLPALLGLTLAALAVASTATVVQRVLAVRRQALATV